MDPEEGECLYRIALEASKKGPIVEIGSYCGKSSIYIGEACKKIIHSFMQLIIILDQKKIKLVGSIMIKNYLIPRPEKLILFQNLEKILEILI